MKNLMKGTHFDGNEIWISICGRKVMQICIDYGIQNLQVLLLRSLILVNVHMASSYSELYPFLTSDDL